MSDRTQRFLLVAYEIAVGALAGYAGRVGHIPARAALVAVVGCALLAALTFPRRALAR
jgi:hypothetical protein